MERREAQGSRAEGPRAPDPHPLKVHLGPGNLARKRAPVSGPLKGAPRRRSGASRRSIPSWEGSRKTRIRAYPGARKTRSREAERWLQHDSGIRA